MMSKDNAADEFVTVALPANLGAAGPICLPTTVVEDSRFTNRPSSKILALKLDTKEQHLFDSLIKAAKAFKEGKLKCVSEPRSIEIRVAGGWVRDKVLGKASHDIDIALDACTGVEFANLVKEYICDFENDKCGKIGVIAANPAQSKHLETATMKIHGIEVDFSNLRHESYANDSRIPTIVIGTPLEDSYRRDFTMNALYYNLRTKEVEDWTRRGLQDLLETRLVVTPLEPFQTFHDDPLRVLRAIRFAVRYGMELSGELRKACMEPQIHKELQRKVSRERVGKELEGMLSGKHANPEKALKLLCDLNLAGSVFCLPSDSFIMHGSIGQVNLESTAYSAENPDELGHLRKIAWEEARECLFILQSVMKQLPEPDESHTPINRRMLYLTTILLPFQNLMYEEKGKDKFTAEYVLREGIKFKNKDVQNIVTITQNLNDMIQLLREKPTDSPLLRLQAGLLLRKAKDLWVTLLQATVISLKRKLPTSSVDWTLRAEEWYFQIVNEMKLDSCWMARPMMNGKELMQLLSLDKGPQVGAFNAQQIRWMLMNPHGTLEECQSFLKIFQKEQESEEDQTAQHISKKMHL